MNCSSPSVEPVNQYVSYSEHDSESAPGVRYRIARMSFARRLELVRKVRDLAQKIEFLDAGTGAQDRIERSVLGGEVDRLYLEWGLQAVAGLTIDGESATPALLIEKGPESLAREIAGRIRAECHLSEDERKN
ncbi:MAG TPA: hypothetical protein VGL53_15090 [Bryobacteraceae bacterium]|jgi:hypothetical protein